MERDVYRVSTSALEDSSKAALEDWRSSLARGAFAYAKVPTHAVAALSSLERVGFSVVDTAITLEHVSPANGTREGNVETALATAEHRADVLRIAETAFKYSRFHLDPRCSDIVANRIKRDWIQNYCDGKRGDTLSVALLVGRAIGFLAAIVTPEVCAIDLVATDSAHQGKGAGRALTMAFVDRYKSSGKRLIVGTQAANIPSIRLYESCGFRFAHAEFIAHLHNEQSHKDPQRGNDSPDA